jgi:hypothetical protein
MKKISMIVLAAMLCSAMASAQNPPMPKPGPEVEKLKYFVGTWKLEGDVKPGMMGPGGKYTGLDRNEWMSGGFYVVGHNTGAVSMGKFTGTSYLGYNPEEKVYTYHEFDSTGENVSAKGNLEGDTWTWTSEDKMNGKLVKSRFTEKITSPASYDFKYEASIDGGEFATIMEGKATKTGPAAGKAADKPDAGAKPASKPAPKSGDSAEKTPKTK